MKRTRLFFAVIIGLLLFSSPAFSETYTYYLPYYTSLSGYWTGVALRNCDSTQSANVDVSAYNTDGINISTESKVIPPNGQSAFVTGQGLNKQGWTKVISTSPLVGLCFFGTAGSKNYMADISLIPELSTDLYVPHVAQTSYWDTTIMICNPQNAAARVTLSFVNANGTTLYTKGYDIPANGSKQCELKDLVQSTVQEQGSVEISSDKGIAAFALYKNIKTGSYSYAGISAVKPNIQTYTYYLPYYTSFSGYWTGIALRNYDSTQSANVDVSAYDNDGINISTESKVIPPNGQSAFVTGQGLNKQGWTKVISTSPLVGLCFFGTAGSNNYMADISLIPELSTRLYVPHVAQTSYWDTTIMICNPQNAAARVTLSFVNANGTTLYTKGYDIPANGSKQCELKDLVQSTVQEQGSVEISSDKGIAAFALYKNIKTGSYSYAGISAVARGSASDDTDAVFDYGTLTQSATQVINSVDGGSVQLNGAVLKINPGTMSENAEISLYAISVPTEKLPAGDGAYGGQTPLSNTSYLIGVDRDVTLSGPISLTLPIDITKLPKNVRLSQLHVSAVNGGIIIPQGTPDSFDAVAGTMRFSFSPPFLKKDFTHQAIIEPPQAAVFPFLKVVALATVKLTAIAGVLASFGLNPLLATVDDVTTTFTFSTYNSEHFNITYRGANVTIGHAIDIAIALEKAHTLFVTQMGFSLPNLINLDFKYTVYLDDLNNHTYFNIIGANGAEGVTLPGSCLFEGASYVNNTASANKWVSTAVHEYFHAVQYGAIQGVIPNLFQRLIYPESGWLFEGSATALSGRVVYGNSAAPARDTQLGPHLAQGISLFNPEQTPGADVAQDFFYYLEKIYGNVTFYRPMFEALGLELGSDAPISVSAADEVIRKSDKTGVANLSDDWYHFIYDMAVENSAQYGGNIEAETKKKLTSAVTSVSHSQNLPPLSYYIIDIDVPKLDSNLPAYNQPRDVKLKIALTSSGNLTGKAIIDAKKGGQRVTGFPKATPFTSAVAFEETLKEFRTENIGWIRIVVVNDALEGDDTISFTATAGFDAVTDAGYHICYLSYAGSSYSSSSELKVKNLSTQTEWTVGQGTPIDLSASGYVVWRSTSDKVMVTSAWGKGSTLDLQNTPECRASSWLGDENISITDAGRLYYAGTYEYVYTNGSKQERRTNEGIVSCLGDGSGFVDVRFDYNQSGGQIDSIDGFTPDELKVAKTGRPIVFNAGNYRLGVVDTSGAGFKWLTTASNLSFSYTGWASDICISGNGERAIFSTQVIDEHHLITVSTASGTPFDLSKSTGLELWSNGASLSPDGNTVLTGYADPTDVGIVLINASSGAIIRKISAFSVGVMPAGSDSPPQFTPDGQFIILSGHKITGTTVDNNPDIFMMKTDGTGVRNLTATPNNAELKVRVR